MSTNPPAPSNQDRRSRKRVKFEQLTYADFGVGSGGILIDLSEGGARFQGLQAVNNGQYVGIGFTLPGARARVEAVGLVVWVNESATGGGLRFVKQNDQTLGQIRSWLLGRTPKASVEQPTQSSSAAQQSALETARLLVGARRAARSVNPQASPLPAAHEIGIPPITPTPGLNIALNPAGSSAVAPQSQTPLTLPPPVPPALPILPLVRSPQISAPAKAEAEQAKLAMPVPAPARVVPPPIEPERPQAMNPRHIVASGSTSRLGRRFAVRSVWAGVLIVAVVIGVRMFTYNRTVNVVDPSRTYTPQTKPSEIPPFDEQVDIPQQSAATPRSRVGGSSFAPATDGVQARQPKPSVGRQVEFRAAVPLQHSTPQYPLSAQQQHLEGTVQIHATISNRGIPQILTFAGGEPRLAEAAMRAVSLWRYKPALRNGQPVESQLDITVSFENKP
jgi:protein TonB